MTSESIAHNWMESYPWFHSPDQPVEKHRLSTRFLLELLGEHWRVFNTCWCETEFYCFGATPTAAVECLQRDFVVHSEGGER